MPATQIRLTDPSPPPGPDRPPRGPVATAPMSHRVA